MNTNRTAETLSAKKHLRRTLPAALVLLAICLVFTAPAGAADTWDSTSSITWYGDGSAKTFTLNTAEDLAGLASLVNSGTSFSGKTVYLADDINLADLGWTPIGYRTDYVTDGTRPFEGIFDGGYHRISGLKITENNIHTGTSSEENAFVGLFGYIYGGTVVKNVIVEGDITITLTESSLYDTVYAGGVVGYPYGSGLARVENCSSDVSITITNNNESGVVHAGGIAGHAFSSTFVNTSSTGSVSATGRSIKVGGLVGSHVGASGNTLSYITNCYATGDVTGTTPEGNSYQVDTGGLVGFSQLTTSIINCYATGDVTSSGIDNTNRVTAGGIIGYTETEIHIRDCFATGDVSGTGKCSNYFVGVGGLVGRLHANSDVENCYAIGDVSGTGTGDSAKVYVGGIAGTPHNSDIVNSYALNQYVSASGTASEFQVNRAVGEGETYQTILSNYGWVGTNVNGTTVTSDDVASVHGKDVGLAWNTLFAGWDSSIWEIGTAENYKLPILKGMPAPVADASYLKVETHTVTFYENGGSDVTDQTLITGDKVSEPTAPTKAGHTFEGWYTEEALTNKFDFSSAVSSDLHLYANWTADTYTVTYNGNGNTSGDIPVDEISYEYDTVVTVLGNTGNLGKTGYMFAGWDNETGYTFNAGDTFKITKDTELKANWTANTTTVIFNANGGGDRGTMENQVFKYGIPQNLQTNTFTNTSGYKFVQWNTTEGVTYQDGTEFNAGVNTAEITLYAEWARYYNVTFNSQGGSSVMLQEVKTGTPASTPTNPSKAGHNFAGWYKEAEGNNVWSFSTPITEDITLYAKWTVVNSGGNGGGSSSSGNVVRPTQPVEPIVPVEPIQPTEPVTPTEPVAPTEPTEQPKPETMPASEAVVEETKAIELTDTNIEKLASGENVAVVELENTEVVQSVAVPEHIAAANPDASVKIAEGNAEPVTLPVGVKTEEVHIVIEVSVVDQSGDKISVDNPGYFVLKVNVPEGKQIVVGHYVDGVWENCDVMVLGNGEVMVYYNSLSPFAAIFIDEGAENPLLNQQTEPTETPAPILGMVLGGLAAAVVLRRK